MSSVNRAKVTGEEVVEVMLKSTVFALLTGALVCGAALGEPPEAQTQEPAEATEPIEIDPNEGWRYYLRYCKSCHGDKGKGDGRIAHLLKGQPSDLTLLSETNDGVFPEEMVARTIDGRVEGNIHGRREMPIWGDVFRETEEIGDDEEAVHKKILELMAVLRSLDRSVKEDGKS